ncbi:M15 family metallopeptidase [Schinkia azotoformans]|uniref:M15 family metallopeptidase n=1 Tax=Schinkia azotoformans TaxID=1454 RepID=UPI002DB5CA0F|nr:M15 family metallopeptidase [Schinkia azotoformans]MEC1718268.1 M15 family metallopeptidase [Schinkia azotoformans]MEC1743718.1 M15 family metallopeptidase [Schinkia azotoformans]MEC1747837.1 M15 family metallopeptidase [Schinkia azotoformans]MEC1760608.1 M15 family metallopeptidase [Schinkia azotoformans]MEC1768144.1 M15 family metallopeptidase [Schinkia azotoformans]
MKKPFIALTIGLVLTGCSNAEIINSSAQSVDAAVPIEEKLIDSEVTEQPIKKETPQENTDSIEKKDEVIKVVSNPDDLLVLVNKKNTLPEDYEPSDLVAPNIPFSFEEDIPKRYVRKAAAEALEELFAVAKEEQIELLGASGYRSYSRQEAIFASNVAKKGEKEARRVSAEAGQSEHQTGLAMDVTSKYVGYDLIEEFGETKEGIWLKNNAHKYGFIIRYPKEKEDITGYIYEPWHIRYVGKDVATVIYENGYTFEEYLSQR